MPGLSFVTLLAYDWRYAFSTIRSYYSIADEIILGLDAERISFSKMRFDFDDDAVARFIAEIDREKKIRIVQGNFHASDAPMNNDMAERRQLGMACRPGNWVVQIDSDEVLLNAAEFRAFLEKRDEAGCVIASWLPVFKIIGDKALVVGGRVETTPVATRSPQRYIQARGTDEPTIMSPLQMLHLSWGRTDEELVQKLTNWSHSKDFDTGRFVEMWRGVTLDNYHRLRDFHPLFGPFWPLLEVMDWPPRSLSEAIPPSRQAAGGANPNERDRPVSVLGRTATGGMVVSFGLGTAAQQR